MIPYVTPPYDKEPEDVRAWEARELDRLDDQDYDDWDWAEQEVRP